MILIGSLEYKTSDERKSGTRHIRDDCLSCESGKLKRGGGSGDAMASEVRKIQQSIGSSLFVVVVSGLWN